MTGRSRILCPANAARVPWSNSHQSAQALMRLRPGRWRAENDETENYVYAIAL